MLKHKILIGLDRATWGYEIKDILENMSLLKLDGLEIQPEHPELFHKFPKIDAKLLDYIESYPNIHLSVHAPIKDINVSSYNPLIREKSIEFLLKTLDFASNFNRIEYIVFHGGQNSFKSNSRFEFKQRKIALERTIDAFKILIEKCNEYGFTMAIENMTHSDYRMTSKIKYLETIFSNSEFDNLKFIFDYEHGLNYSERYSLRILKNFKNRLIAVHIGTDYDKFAYLVSDINPILVIEPHHFYNVDRIFDKIRNIINTLNK
ncbi:MAG: sugar phosphate isomerase/epimerase family protein [Candidatus Helarchaeota archaeon]